MLLLCPHGTPTCLPQNLVVSLESSVTLPAPPLSRIVGRVRNTPSTAGKWNGTFHQDPSSFASSCRNEVTSPHWALLMRETEGAASSLVNIASRLSLSAAPTSSEMQAVLHTAPQEARCPSLPCRLLSQHPGHSLPFSITEPHLFTQLLSTAVLTTILRDTLCLPD